MNIKLLLLIITIIAQSSCGNIGGLDPAESLASIVEREAQSLVKSDLAVLRFAHIPSIEKVEESPNFDGDIEIRVIASGGDYSYSLIQVERWFRTTYHNRFVVVDHPMEATKKPGEPFEILLTKSGDKIKWVDLK